MIAGIVLAGGASTRMGQPKALLQLGGLTLAERAFNLLVPHCTATVIITGAHDLEIRQALPHLSTFMLCNTHHALGMFSSLSLGLANFPQASAILFTPVDFAAVHPASVQKLFDAAPAPLTKPRCQGHSGHPILVRDTALAALRAAAPTANAKQILSAFPSQYLDVDDRAVAEDCDTPHDYQRLLSWWQPLQPAK